MHPVAGLGVRLTNGELQGVMWPFGFTARSEVGAAVLIDADGRVVAREGDTVRFSGTPLGDGSFFACTGAAVIPPT
jgi:hypothetical protein